MVYLHTENVCFFWQVKKYQLITVTKPLLIPKIVTIVGHTSWSYCNEIRNKKHKQKFPYAYKITYKSKIKTIPLA